MVRDKESVFIDSFGALPPIEVNRFAKQGSKPMYFNNWIIQDLKSFLCGFYCIAAILYAQVHSRLPIREVLNDFVNMFVDDTTKNGKILKAFLGDFHFRKKGYLIRSK